MRIRVVLLTVAAMILAVAAQAAPSLLSLERVSAEVGVGFRYSVDHAQAWDVGRFPPQAVAQVGYQVLPSLKLVGEVWMPTETWKADKEARVSARWVLRK